MQLQHWPQLILRGALKLGWCLRVVSKGPGSKRARPLHTLPLSTSHGRQTKLPGGTITRSKVAVFNPGQFPDRDSAAILQQPALPVEWGCVRRHEALGCQEGASAGGKLPFLDVFYFLQKSNFPWTFLPYFLGRKGSAAKL